MRETRVVISDDLLWSRNGERVDATETHILRLDDTEVELDLTAENGALLLDDLKMWLDAGHKPSRSADDPSGQPEPAGNITSARSLLAVMRRYGDTNGLGEGKGYKHRGGGKAGYDYDPLLKVAFQAYLKQVGSDWADHPALRPGKKGKGAQP